MVDDDEGSRRWITTTRIPLFTRTLVYTNSPSSQGTGSANAGTAFATFVPRILTPTPPLSNPNSSNTHVRVEKGSQPRAQSRRLGPALSSAHARQTRPDTGFAGREGAREGQSTWKMKRGAGDRDERGAGLGAGAAGHICLF